MEKQNEIWDQSQYKALCFQLAKLTKLGLRLLISTSENKDAIAWAENCMMNLEESFPSIGEDRNEQN